MQLMFGYNRRVMSDRYEAVRIGEEGMAAWRAFLNAHARVIGRIEEDLGHAGRLPLSEYDVLVALSEAPGRRLRMHELADRVVLSRSGLTRLVDRLERSGLLRRERCGSDRRGAYAVLTEEGRGALEAAWPVYGRGIREYFLSYLADGELDALAEALGRVGARDAASPDTA